MNVYLVYELNDWLTNPSKKMVYSKQNVLMNRFIKN